jgi:chromosome condensin MukBEF complex kleisin-like MukF subunit
LRQLAGLEKWFWLAHDERSLSTFREKASMAKRRNKAGKIREYLAEQPQASAAEVVKALAAQRVRVSPAQVYNVKATAGKPKAANGYESVIQAKRLADAMGGIDKARAALDVLAKLL